MMSVSSKISDCRKRDRIFFCGVEMQVILGIDCSVALSVTSKPIALGKENKTIQDKTCVERETCL